MEFKPRPKLGRLFLRRQNVLGMNFITFWNFCIILYNFSFLILFFLWIQYFSVKELALKLKTLKLKTKFMMAMMIIIMHKFHYLSLFVSKT